jgi:hypothetical protein
MTIQSYIQTNKIDGILFKTDHLFTIAGTDVNKRADALKEVAYSISMLRNPIKEEDYIKSVSRVSKQSTKLWKEAVNALQVERKQSGTEKKTYTEGYIPDWADADSWNIHGFDGLIDGLDTGFYFNVGGGAVRQTNFTLTPVVHIYSDVPEDNVRVTELCNGLETRVIDMPTKAFLSPLDFENTLGGFGNFMGLNGFGKNHLNRIKGKLWPNYPFCNELKTLGWQDSGFFSYSNMIYNNGFVKFNEYGVATIDGVNYISKSASTKKVMMAGGDDQFENDKYLKFTEAGISFKMWCQKMVNVYGVDGNVAASFALLTLFRDVVFKVDNNCPMLYAYGEAMSGKSKFAESVGNLFFRQMPAFNLNQGTDVAFWNRLMRFKNCPVQFNEFDENAIKEEWFRALKAVYDGEGRERGTIKKGKSEVQKVNCTVILMGQYLSTKDDNSVLSRTIPVHFKKQNERSKAVLDAYDDLKDLEKKGLNGILTEMLVHRVTVQDRYATVLGEVKTEMLQALRKAGVVGETRIITNYSHILAMCKLMAPLIGFSIAYADFFKHCEKEITRLSNMMSESNVLSDFWRTVERLMDTQQIEQGFDFKIQTDNQVTKMINRKDTDTIHFESSTEVLYIRLSNVHTAYMQLKRSSTGKSGINMQTIEMYMRDQPYYIGHCKSSAFRSFKTKAKTNTSCIMIKYDPLLQANLQRSFDGNAAVAAAASAINDREEPAITADSRQEDLPF